MKTVLIPKTKFSEYLDTIFLFGIYALAFLIPLLIKHPQIVVGICINALIAVSTLKYGFKKTIPALLLPSLAAYLQGVLFGGATMFLIYLIPFIILSNAIYSLVINNIKQRVPAVILASILKVSLLFSIANIFVNSNGFPQIFLKTMGINQLITALVGGSIAITVLTVTQNDRAKNTFK